ncbi:TBC1 domain family member 1 isoform A [Micractinium conductrix]|uniref:TBC1 domain family member 1 isoform A n=1 Tax=Micractinium conductrix TaxID=554055 RepID=A0A2P6VP08_9CHLO|nr:TBC1 domain family member 1 isoform A [Micractinium conductrix]|eukprot:PSC75797.1 TBC1 domain family member 1 isoform A [Micractinium conductrix]
MRLAEFAGWLATQVFDVVGTFAGVQGADGGAVVDLQVGKTCFHDVPAKMRTELWLSQLQRKGPQGGAPTQGEYYDLLFETLSPEVLSDIDKDTHRTFPGHPRLTTPAGQRAMLNVLSAYALSDPAIGYTQGMNFLAGVLLTWLPAEADAFAALSLLMRQRGLREMYLPDMSLLQVRLWQLSKLLPPRLAAHLEAHTVLPVLYASSWLLTAFAADFPLHFAGRLVDVLLTGHQVASPVLKVAVAIVQRCERDLLRMNDFEEMVHFLRQDVPQWSKTQLQELLTDALSKPWSARQLRVLEQMNGAETVMEAVQRVEGLTSRPTADAAELAAALEGAGSSSGGGGGMEAQRGQQAEQQQEATPGNVAGGRQPLLLPPPPPAGAQAGSVPWGAAEAPTIAVQKLRIDHTVAEEPIDLGPHLSQALSCYVGGAAGTAGAAGGGTASAGAERSPPSVALTPSPPLSSRQAPGALQPVGSDAAAATAAVPQQQQQAALPSPSINAEAQARWDTFARDTSLRLHAAPSPFESSAGVSSATPIDYPTVRQQQQLPGQGGVLSAAAATAAAAAAARGGSQQQPQPPAASSHGSLQLGSMHSALPLLDLLAQPAAGGTGSGAGSPSPMSAFLNLFRNKSPSPERGEEPTGSDSDIQDAPSSHGSSLAAVLEQLGISRASASGAANAAGGGAAAGATGAAGPAAAGGGGRRLRHSSEMEEWSGWKTGHSTPDRHSMASAGSDARRQGSTSSALASSASGPLAQHAQPQGSGIAAAATVVPQHGTAQPGTPTDRQRSPRLSSDEANQRASSLAEQHLAGFLASGKQDAARTQQQQQQQQQPLGQ